MLSTTNSTNAKTLAQAIEEKFDGHTIRIKGQMICASDMCKVNSKKRWVLYKDNKQTKEYIQSLESVVGIPTTDLIISVQGGDAKAQGTWVHPYIAIDLARWISPKFAIFMTKLTARFISGDLTLAQEVVERANQVTGKINNIEIATNPDNGKTIAVTKQFESTDRVAKKAFRKLQRKYKKLQAELDQKIKPSKIKMVNWLRSKTRSMNLRPRSMSLSN